MDALKRRLSSFAGSHAADSGPPGKRGSTLASLETTPDRAKSVKQRRPTGFFGARTENADAAPPGQVTVQPHFKSARQRRPTAFAGASLVEDDEVDEQGELDADESQAGDHHHQQQQQQQQQQQRSAEVVQDPHARRTSESIADVHIKVAELNAKVNMGEPVEEIELVRAMCLAHKLFEQMSPVQAEQLLERLQPQQLQKEEILFSAGDTGSDMFVVCSGVLACINKDGNTVKLLGRGAYRVWGVDGAVGHRQCGDPDV